MARRLVEVQRTEEVETTSRIMVDVPDAVAESDDPDELTEWVGQNVSEATIGASRAVMHAKVIVVSADLIN